MNQMKRNIQLLTERFAECLVAVAFLTSKMEVAMNSFRLVA